MAKGATTPMRVTADLAAKAASIAPTENRTVTEQVNYWARIGMQLERAASVDSRRVLAAAAGDAQFSTLSPEERAAAHATIDAQIAERVAGARFGSATRANGQRTVSLDDDGRLIEVTADGTRRLL